MKQKKIMLLMGLVAVIILGLVVYVTGHQKNIEITIKPDSWSFNGNGIYYPSNWTLKNIPQEKYFEQVQLVPPVSISTNAKDTISIIHTIGPAIPCSSVGPIIKCWSGEDSGNGDGEMTIYTQSTNYAIQTLFESIVRQNSHDIYIESVSPLSAPIGAIIEIKGVHLDHAVEYTGQAYAYFQDSSGNEYAFLKGSEGGDIGSQWIKIKLENKICAETYYDECLKYVDLKPGVYDLFTGWSNKVKFTVTSK